MDLFIGLDLGGTWLKYGLAGRDGKLLVRQKRPSEAQKGPEAIFGSMTAAVHELLDKAKQWGRVQAIGVGSPGLVDYRRGILAGGAPNLPGWEGADIRGVLEGRFGLPTFADNDANVMALAEARLGAAQGARQAIFLTLGTGIGGGILIDGQLYRGAWFAGAELGHTVIKFDGRPCGCGNIGCVEQYASAPGMIRTYLERLEAAGKEQPARITTEEIFARANQGEPEAKKAIEDTAYYLGVAMASFVNIFNPEVIVVGGGVAEAGDEFIQMAERVAKKLAQALATRGLRIVRAGLGNDAGTVGAILLAAESYDSQMARGS
ncbi:MAG: ROK family protein [candidate division KSB1 bacterium]|nr:ROK family protein [candidate division KSB1 bacterium]